MPKKALVDFAFIKELSESIVKKDKRFFRAKVKNLLNNGKRSKKIEEIRHLLMAAAKSNKKSRKKKDRGKRLAKRDKPGKLKKTFTQFEATSSSDSGSGSSSGSSSDSEPDSAADKTKKGPQSSTGSSSSESENEQKVNN